MSWLSRLFGSKNSAEAQKQQNGKKQIGEATSRPEDASSSQQRGQESPRQTQGLLSEFDRLGQLQDLGQFFRGRSEGDLESFIREFPFSDVRLDYASVQRDFRNSRRTEMVLYLARVLIRWKDYASDQRWQGLLPRTLNASRLYDALSPGLFSFLEAQRGTDIAMVLRTALYDFAMDLVREDKNREAMVCLEISRPSPKEDHDFWLCACYHNIGKLEKDQNVIRKGLKLAEEMMTGKSKASPSVLAKMRQVDLLGKLRAMASEF